MQTQRKFHLVSVYIRLKIWPTLSDNINHQMNFWKKNSKILHILFNLLDHVSQLAHTEFVWNFLIKEKNKSLIIHCYTCLGDKTSNNQMW